MSGEMELSQRDRQVIDLEREWWLESRPKQQVIRSRLSCSPASYYATLRRLVSSDEAFSYDPLVMQRLRRRRDDRRRGGSASPADARHRPR